MRVKSLTLAAFAAVSLGAAARAESADPYAALANTTWQATEIAGRPVDIAKHPTLSFGPNREINGAGACNQYTARYTPDASDPAGRLVTIRVQGWTKMACHDGRGEIDSMLDKALERTKRFESVPGGLIAYDGAGAITLRFVPADAPKR